MSTPSHKRLRILFADDEQHLQELMRIELPRMGHEVTVCPDGRTALAALEKGTYDAAVLDLQMPGMTGLEILGRLRDISPQTEAVILTGHATLDTAVGALRHGAFDYLTKPCKLLELEAILDRIAEKRELTHRAIALESRLRAAEGTPDLIGDTAAMQDIRRLIDTVAPTHSTVMILGETGTGKELVARNLHDRSKRAAMPFVAVNCGALPENLVESELFGHRKGAFTGADQHRKGLFEVANGGTLFLDEVGELGKNVQVKLLRFLESGELRRVGENDPFHVDVRVVCATNRELVQMVRGGGFREDLYFRLNVVSLHIPPLRERREEIPAFVEVFLRRYGAKYGRPRQALSPALLRAFSRHAFPGNVRELENLVKRIVVLESESSILEELLGGGEWSAARAASAFEDLLRSVEASAGKVPLREVGRRAALEAERETIERVLHRTHWNRKQAARLLGVSYKTLLQKIRECGLGEGEQS